MGEQVYILGDPHGLFPCIALGPPERPDVGIRYSLPSIYIFVSSIQAPMTLSYFITDIISPQRFCPNSPGSWCFTALSFPQVDLSNSTCSSSGVPRGFPRPVPLTSLKVKTGQWKGSVLLQEANLLLKLSRYMILSLRGLWAVGIFLLRPFPPNLVRFRRQDWSLMAS